MVVDIVGVARLHSGHELTAPTARAPRIRAYGLAACGGDIHVALDRIEGMMWFQTTVVARVRDGGHGSELEIRGGSGEILDAESCEESIYVCGTFTGISGVESIHLARWTP